MKGTVEDKNKGQGELQVLDMKRLPGGLLCTPVSSWASYLL